MTWNAENVKKNIFALADFLNAHQSSLVFLSEPQAYQADLPSIVQYVKHDYFFSLNSDDLADPELPLVCSKARGGTMVLWRRWLDPYVRVIPVTSSAFLPILLTLPECRPSVHVALYLPTHGQDTEFVSEIANLKNCLDRLNSTHNYPLLYIRGDANVNCKNLTRVKVLKSFMAHFNLVRIEITHKTYHHFVGAGQYDSNVDVILHTVGTTISGMQQEKISGIICQKITPVMSSHHDVILSSFHLPPGDAEPESDGLICAPKLDIQRVKVMWTEDGIDEYSEQVSSLLRYIRSTWLHPSSQASMSVLLQLTNVAM